MLTIEEVKILDHRQIHGPYYYLQLMSHTIASSAIPGQFLHIRCGESLDPLLRRPLSLHRICKETGALGILYQVKGRGTALLSKRRPYERLSVLGPCGKGFQLPLKGPVLVVAGGIGIAPLGTLVEAILKKGIEVHLLIGARTEGDLLGREDFKHPLLSLYLATDDASVGFPGLVTDLAEEVMEIRSFSSIYGCGPSPMLKKLVAISSQRDVPCQISLEGRMGCGMGFCLTCGVKKGSGEGYHRLCTEGPVFMGEEVSFDDY